MEIKMFVKLMVFMILLFKAVNSFDLSEPCPKYTKQFCACNGTEKAKAVPMRMCFYDDYCEPCPFNVQDEIDCNVCPDNECPVCSDSKDNLQEKFKKYVPDMMTLFERARKSREAWEPLPHDSWCPFNRNTLNGQVECTYTTYSKDCLLSCYEPYTVDGAKEFSFACKRKENVWKPEIRSCEDASGAYRAPETPEEPEEPQHSMPKIPGLEEKSANNHNKDFHDKEVVAGDDVTHEKEESTFDSVEDHENPIAETEKGKATSSLASDSLDDGHYEKIDEGIFKEFYDLLKSEGDAHVL